MQLIHLRKAIKVGFVGSLLLVAVSWHLKGQFVDSSEIDPALANIPLQTATREGEFSFAYKGKVCRAKPVAKYELWGLVVSHNNIESMADLVHDSTSVDTKDLCVIWGKNVASNEFHEVDYTSGQFTCYFRYPHGTKFHHNALGNNHLITDQQAIRDQIAAIRIGDQVRLEGLLVNYQMDDWEGFWRKTSKVRNDAGCEVIFVREVEVLQRGTPFWYAAFDWGKMMLLLLPAVYLFVVWLEARNPETSRLGEI